MPDLDDQKELEWFKHQTTHLGRLAEFTHAFELASLRYLFLINGGAEIAFLALLGTDARKIFNLYPAGIAIALWAFALFGAMAAARQMYYSQFNFYKARSQEVQEIRNRDAGRIEDAEANIRDQKVYYTLANKHRDNGHGFTDLSWGLFGGGVSFAIISYIAGLRS